MSQFLYDVFTASFDRRDLRYHQFQHGDENYNFFSAMLTVLNFINS